jgi:molecular chaperone DnaK
MSLIGIDLGTTFSAVAYLEPDGRPVTIPNAEGELVTPSVILFDTDTNAIVGREARRAALVEPDRVAYDVKRYMGDEFYPRPIAGQRFSPISLSSLILRKLKQDAEARVGAVEGAVITVPAYFDESRRQATAAAAEAAGLKVIDIINEPTAAALAYAYRSAGPARPAGDAAATPKTLVVYDLGGGTFDVTLLRADGNTLTVLATAGDVRLGGRDWDERLANHLAEEFIRSYKSDPREDPMTLQQLMQNAEELKKDLSRRTNARYAVSHAGRSLRGEVTRQKFEELTNDLLFRTESRITRVLRDTNNTWDRIDELLCVGGSTRMPQVIDMLRRVSGKTPNTSLAPDEAVAHGAAIHAHVLAAQGAAADHAGAGDSSIFRRFGDRLLHTLRSMHTTSVNSHSLGVVVEDGQGRQFVSHLIPRNTPLPAHVKRCYATLKENQRQVNVQIVEGESQTPEDCLLIGTCRIEALPAGLAKGSPVEVTFRYDRSGRLHVEAVHVVSGTWAESRIERRAGLDPSRIQITEDMLARLSVS